MNGASPRKRNFPAQISEGARENARTVSRMAGRVYPACARTKKPIAGGPGIGAQFWSFNFTNKVIWVAASSRHQVRRTQGLNFKAT
jgi:hypothetical protein